LANNDIDENVFLPSLKSDHEKKGFSLLNCQLREGEKNDQILSWQGMAGQGCQMVYFRTKNTNLGKFWRILQ
jgi:hypothetical protein